MHVIIIVTPLAGRASAFALLRISWPMSAPVLLGYAEGGGDTERKKDRTQNKVIQNPGDACAEERQGGEQSKVARLGVHFPNLKGAATRLPLPCARVNGLEPPKEKPWPPAAGRQAIFLGATEPRAARPEETRRGATPSRPRPVAGVNELVKYADIDAR